MRSESTLYGIDRNLKTGSHIIKRIYGDQKNCLVPLKRQKKNASTKFV